MLSENRVSRGLPVFDSFLAVHVALPKRPINQLKLVQQSRQKELRAYCSNIYTVQNAKESFGNENLPVSRVRSCSALCSIYGNRVVINLQGGLLETTVSF